METIDGEVVGTQSRGGDLLLDSVCLAKAKEPTGCLVALKAEALREYLISLLKEATGTFNKREVFTGATFLIKTTE